LIMSDTHWRLPSGRAECVATEGNRTPETEHAPEAKP
jgi:hypothetical protein